MRTHLGRAIVVTVALVELGARAGASVACLFLTLWALVHGHGVPHRMPGVQELLSMLLWGVVVGAPLGGVALPVVGLTVLRRTPLGRAVAFPLAGMLVGFVIAALVIGETALWPLPLLVPALALVGLLAGVAIARTGRRGAPPNALTRFSRELHRRVIRPSDASHLRAVPSPRTHAEATWRRTRPARER
jgi:hypothetical protein